MSVGDNLAARMRLLRIALGRRYIFDDLASIVREHGFQVDDLKGSVEPFSLLERVLGKEVCELPNFQSCIPSDMIDERDYTVGWSAEPSVSLFLGRLAVASRASTIVEVGSFIGWTSAHLALALEFMGDARGVLHLIECNAGYLEKASANLTKLGLQRWTRLHVGHSLDSTLLAKLPEKADLIFLDTSHSYEDTSRELSIYLLRVAPGGCLALHDSVNAPGVRRAIHDLRSACYIHTFATERGNGLTVLFPQ